MIPHFYMPEFIFCSNSSDSGLIVFAYSYQSRLLLSKLSHLWSKLFSHKPYFVPNYTRFV